jgi:hypothetical protein
LNRGGAKEIPILNEHFETVTSSLIPLCLMRSYVIMDNARFCRKKEMGFWD